MKSKIWKHRKKYDFYRVMEIVSAGFMGYGMLQIAAAEEMAKTIPKTEMTLIVMGTILGLLIIALGWLSRRLFKGLRIAEMKAWKEDEKAGIQKGRIEHGSGKRKFI